MMCSLSAVRILRLRPGNDPDCGAGARSTCAAPVEGEQDRAAAASCRPDVLAVLGRERRPP